MTTRSETVGSQPRPVSGHPGGPPRPVTAPARRAELHLLRRLLHPHRRQVWLAFSALVLTAIFMLVPPLLLQQVIDAGIDKHDKGTILTYVLILLVIELVGAVVVAVGQYQTSTLSARVIALLRRQLNEHYQALPAGYFERADRGQLISRVENDAAAIDVFLKNVLPNLIIGLVTVVGSVAGMVYLDWLLALVVAPVTVLILAATVLYKRHVTPVFSDVRLKLGGLTGSAKRALESMAMIRRYRQGDREARAFSVLNEENFGVQLRAARMSSLFSPSTGLFAVLGTAAVVGFGGTEVVDGSLEIGVLIAFFMYFNQLISPVSILGLLETNYEAAIAAADKIYDALQVEPDVREEDGAGALTVSRGDVAVVGLSFGYGESTVFDGLDLVIPGGAANAVAAQPGAGKTALAKLLVRFEAPHSGRIEIDGTDIASVTIASLRRQVVDVPREPDILAGTVRDNFRFALPELSDEDIERAFEAIGHGDLVAGLPEGLDTKVTRGGPELPKGERLLVGVARAAAARPAILVVDGTLDGLDSVDAENTFAALRGLDGVRNLIVMTAHTGIAGLADRTLEL